MWRIARTVAVVLIVVAIALALALGGCGSSTPAPEDYGALEDFTLTSQDGAPFGTSQLRGKTWVVNFVFTECPGVCPTLSAAMRALQTRLRERGRTDVQLVTITVDPEHDTPEVLRAYAQRFSADTSSWTFLTGEPATVRRVVVGGFKQAVGDREPSRGQPDAYDIMHSMKIVLVDGNAHLRGFYSADVGGQAELLAAIDALGGPAR